MPAFIMDWRSTARGICNGRIEHVPPASKAHHRRFYSFSSHCKQLRFLWHFRYLSASLLRMMIVLAILDLAAEGSHDLFVSTAPIIRFFYRFLFAVVLRSNYWNTWTADYCIQPTQAYCDTNRQHQKFSESNLVSSKEPLSITFTAALVEYLKALLRSPHSPVSVSENI